MNSIEYRDRIIKIINIRSINKLHCTLCVLDTDVIGDNINIEMCSSCPISNIKLYGIELCDGLNENNLRFRKMLRDVINNFNINSHIGYLINRKLIDE